IETLADEAPHALVVAVPVHVAVAVSLVRELAGDAHQFALQRFGLAFSRYQRVPELREFLLPTAHYPLRISGVPSSALELLSARISPTAIPLSGCLNVNELSREATAGSSAAPGCLQDRHQ